MEKLKFARMINRLTVWGMRELEAHEIKELDELTTPVFVHDTWSLQQVNIILKLVAEGKKIDAIKLHRQLSGYGLKEAKDAVEGKFDDGGIDHAV